MFADSKAAPSARHCGSLIFLLLSVCPLWPAECTVTGEQKTLVLLLETSTARLPSSLNATAAANLVSGPTQSASAYWREVSGDRLWFTADVIGPRLLAGAYGSGTQDSEQGQLWNEARNIADSLVDMRSYTRLVVLAPAVWRDSINVGWLGCRPQPFPSKGLLNVSTVLIPVVENTLPELLAGTLAHELGHNLGLSHASTMDYSGIAGPMGSGEFDEYGDWFSIMGNSYFWGHIAAPHKARLGWLTEGKDLRTVESPGSFVLTPYEAGGDALKVLKLRRSRDPDSWLWLEYRQPRGFDSNFRSIQTNIFEGITVHSEDPYFEPYPGAAPSNGFDGSAYTFLVNMRASPGHFREPVLKAGATWTDGFSLLSLTAGPATESGIGVTVQYAQPCASLSPGQIQAPPGGASGQIVISAPPDCAWDASSGAAWVRLDGPSSGRGSASIGYAVEGNPTTFGRKAAVTIQRQTIPVVQAGENHAPKVASLSPGLGAGEQATFSISFTDPDGVADLAGATLAFWANGSPGNCIMSFAFNATSNFLSLAREAGGGGLSPMLAPGDTASVEHNSCRVEGRTFSVVKSGVDVRVTVAIQFKPAMSGVRFISASARDRAGARTPEYDVFGQWVVPGASCAFALSTSRLQIPPTGGPAPVEVATPAGCTWNASSPAAWIRVQGTGSRSGSGLLWMEVDANAGGTRSATLQVAGNQLVVEQAASLDPPGLRFVPVTPCRVSDTRNATGPFGGPFLSAGSSRSFSIPQSGCGIPSRAQAYSLNVTVVPRGPLGWLTLWPTGQPRPTASTLNSYGGDVVANAAIVPAGTNGEVSVYVSDASEVILDISGYFEGSAGSAYYADTPCRVADTRWPTGPLGGPIMGGGTRRSFSIPAGPCSIPANATAYAMNYTVVPAGNLSYLSTWPTGQSMPVVSTLNSWRGKVVANAAIVPAGSGGSVDVLVTDPTHVILDINGHFGAPGGTGALSFYPVTPCRVADTRAAAGPFGGPILTSGGTRSFAIPQSACGIPATAKAYSVNVTVVPARPLSYLTAWPAGGAQPYVSTLNSWDGTVVANAAIVPAGINGAISFFVTDPSHLVLDINGYFQ